MIRLDGPESVPAHTVADLIGVSTDLLRAWRKNRGGRNLGPRSHGRGAHVAYRLADIEIWANARRADGTLAIGPGGTMRYLPIRPRQAAIVRPGRSTRGLWAGPTQPVIRPAS